MKSGISPAATWFSTSNLVLAGLLVFTLIVRGSVLWGMRSNLNQDPDAYREIAENLLRHGEFAMGKPGSDGGVSKPLPTAYRPPLYPIVLSNLPAADGHHISLIKVAVLHLILGVATVWLTWLTAQRIIASSPWHAPLLAGLLVACDPILLNQQTLVMTETLAAFLVILSLWCLARFDQSRTWFNAALAGGAIGLAILCRPTFLPWLGVVGLVTLCVGGRRSEVRSQKSEMHWLTDFGWRFANLATLCILAAAVVSPWAIRNYRVFGKPIVATTHGGYTLLLGNNSDFYKYLNAGSMELPWIPAEGSLFREQPSAHFWNPQRGPDFEISLDKQLYEYAYEDIRTDLSTFVRACLYRLRQLWSPLPHKLTKDESTGRKLLRYGTCAWYCGDYVLVAIGIWRLRWQLLQPPWIWGVLLCLAFTAVHTFYWTNLRMRAPLMPFVAMVAAAAVMSKVPSPELLNAEP